MKKGRESFALGDWENEGETWKSWVNKWFIYVFYLCIYYSWFILLQSCTRNRVPLLLSFAPLFFPDTWAVWQWNYIHRNSLIIHRACVCRTSKWPRKYFWQNACHQKSKSARCIYCNRLSQICTEIEDGFASAMVVNQPYNRFKSPVKNSPLIKVSLTLLSDKLMLIA